MQAYACSSNEHLPAMSLIQRRRWLHAWHDGAPLMSSASMLQVWGKNGRGAAREEGGEALPTMHFEKQPCR